METVEHLASYKRCAERIRLNWLAFADRRRERLQERERFGHAAERATENIVEDLFTLVLDWSLSDVNHQVGYADLMFTRLGLKYLIVEAKAPGSLAWNRRAVGQALEQACRYAAEQKVKCVAVSAGLMFYAADVVHGGLSDRVFCSLEHPDAPPALWWLSVDGIYRETGLSGGASLRLLPEASPAQPIVGELAGGALVHPKYRLPASCFAYVDDPSDPHTWHLPYLNPDGTVDAKRLPKAVQAILSNYRGAHLASVPEPDIPEVLVRLGCAAASLGKLPGQTLAPADAYVKLAAALEQLGRLDAVRVEGI
jgi:hypothetical protein